MHLKELRYLLAINQAGNITEAARRLYLSQPSLSQFINRYESELGFKIFIRTHSGVLPTPAGKTFLATLQSIVNYYDSTVSDITATLATESAPIKLAIPDQRAMTLIPYLLRHLPNYNLEFIEDFNDVLRQKIANGSADFWVTGVPSVNFPELNCTVLCQEEIFLAIPPTHPLAEKIQTSSAGRKFIEHDMLSGQEFFMCHERRHLCVFANEYLKAHQINAHLLFHSSNIVTAISSALSANALTFVPAGFISLNSEPFYISLGENGLFWDINLAYKSPNYLIANPYSESNKTDIKRRQTPKSAFFLFAEHEPEETPH